MTTQFPHHLQESTIWALKEELSLLKINSCYCTDIAFSKHNKELREIYNIEFIHAVFLICLSIFMVLTNA
jgi:hypothetical protein